MKLDGSHLSLISNGNQKSNATVWAGFIKLNKIPGSHILYLCSWRFFRLEGREKNAWSRAPCLLWDILPSCGNSLIGLKLWAVPPREPGPANGRENRTWTRAWPLYIFLCGLAGAGTVSLRACLAREGPGPRSQPAASSPFLTVIPLRDCSLLDVPAHTPKAAEAHSSHSGPSCSGPGYLRHQWHRPFRVLGTGQSTARCYSWHSAPGPHNTGGPGGLNPKGQVLETNVPVSPRGSQSSPHFGDWGPAPLLPVAGLPGGPGGLRAPRPPWSLAKPRTRLSADPARPQRKRETGQAWVQVLLVLHGSGPPPRLGLARKSSSQLGPGQTVSARWQYCPRSVPAPRLVLPPFESEKTPWTDKGLRK